MVRVEFGNDFGRIVGGNISEAGIKKLLSYPVQGAVYTKAYREGRWDGRKSLYKYGKFPSGLVRDVCNYCSENGVQFKLVDLRVRPKPSLNFDWTFEHDMRDYQKDAVLQAVTSSRGSIVIGTGGGKMAVACRIVYELKVPSLILVNSIEALWDTVNEFNELLFKFNVEGEGVGYWGGGEKKLSKDVNVATIQSLYLPKKPKEPETDNVHHHKLYRKKFGSYNAKIESQKDLVVFLKNCKLLILDEMQHAAADQWFDISMKSGAYYKFGMTGTLNRQDNKDIYFRAFAGKKLCDYPVRWLMDRNYLCEVSIKFYEASYEISNYDWFEGLVTLGSSEVYTEGIVKNVTRNKLILKLAFDNPENKSTVIIVSRVEHAEILSSMGDITYVTGKTSKKDRKQIKKDINSGKLKYIIATSLYDESVNNPIWKRCINAGGFSPENAQTQRLGRILRVLMLLEAEFIDFIDSFEERLMRHSEKRIDYMKTEGHQVELITLGSDDHILSNSKNEDRMEEIKI